MDLDKMVGMLEVDVGEQSCFSWAVQEIRDPGKWVLVFLCDFVKSMEIDTKLE